MGFGVVKKVAVIKMGFSVMNFSAESETILMFLLLTAWIIFCYFGLLLDEPTFHIYCLHMFWPIITKNVLAECSLLGSVN